MREVQKKMKPEMFDAERLARIEALRRVIGKYSGMFSGDDWKLIIDALGVHAALIRMFEKEAGK